MPTVDWNKKIWDGAYDWSEAGEEWSEVWGGSDMQWYGAILPRLQAYVPTGALLEIAPGFGRWTRYLKDLCDELVLVDLSEACIDACRQRFADCDGIAYHTNDGMSLPMVDSESIDLAFTFDSLVHVEDEVIQRYLEDMRRVLKPDGIGFVHHSNLGEYAGYFSMVNRIPWGRRTLAKLGLIEIQTHRRADSMTAGRFEELARQADLIPISQEIINWGTKRMIDCISIVTLPGSRWQRPNQRMRNPDFMREARQLGRLAPLYRGHGEGFEPTRELCSPCASPAKLAREEESQSEGDQ
jgi:ubiquinone/menaquinone biosynthesis C-methylase UbiE